MIRANQAPGKSYKDALKFESSSSKKYAKIIKEVEICIFTKLEKRMQVLGIIKSNLTN